MKTKSSNTLKAQNRPELLSTENAALAQAAAPEQKRPPIDFNRRSANRALNTERLLALLQKDAPNFFALAEVVGKWVWIHFSEKQPVEVTASLAELGFHWNNKRQTWQHPCGLIRDRRLVFDPRRKYGSYFTADAKPA